MAFDPFFTVEGGKTHNSYGYKRYLFTDAERLECDLIMTLPIWEQITALSDIKQRKYFKTGKVTNGELLFLKRMTAKGKLQSSGRGVRVHKQFVSPKFRSFSKI